MPPCYPAVRIYNSGQRALARPRMGRSVGPKLDGPGGRSAYMGESTGRGLAKSVGRFSSRALPRSFGFPILRNRVLMGFGRSNLDWKMHNFKGFDFVHSNHFFVNDSANQNRAGRLSTANRPSRRSCISEFALRRARFSCTSRAGARHRGGTVGQGRSADSGIPSADRVGRVR